METRLGSPSSSSRWSFPTREAWSTHQVSPFRLERDSAIGFTVRVFSGGPDNPVDVEDTSRLIEIRDTAGATGSIRFGDMERIAPGTYGFSHGFTAPGEYLVVVQPDVENRDLLHPESTDEVRVIVSDIVPSTREDRNTIGIIASVLLVLLVGALVVGTTRGRSRPLHPETKPIPHDSWWNPP